MLKRHLQNLIRKKVCETGLKILCLYKFAFNLMGTMFHCQYKWEENPFRYQNYWQ